MHCGFFIIVLDYRFEIEGVVRHSFSILGEGVQRKRGYIQLDIAPFRLCTKAICGVAFGIRARSRTYVRSLCPSWALVPYGTLPSPSGLASHPSFRVSAHLNQIWRKVLRATFSSNAKVTNYIQLHTTQKCNSLSSFEFPHFCVRGYALGVYL